MTELAVDEMLTQYTENKARCAHIDCEIAWREAMLEQLSATIIEDSVRISQNLDGMPHSGKISDPTAMVAVNVADGMETEDMRAMRKEITELKAERKRKSISVYFVDAWLMALNPKEKLIIETQVINHMYWRDVLSKYADAFNDVFTKEGLRLIKKNAMRKIYKIAA